MTMIDEIDPCQDMDYTVLEDPDANLATDKSQFAWGQDFQGGVLAALLSDRQFLAENADLLKGGYWTYKVHKKIASILLDHFRTFKSIPSKMAMKQELRDSVKAEDRILYEGELITLYDSYHEGLDDRDYLGDKILSFARECSIRDAYFEAVKVIQEPKNGRVNWEKVYDIFQNARLERQDFDPGLIYFDSLDERYARLGDDQDEAEKFSTGCLKLDMSFTGGGMRRGEIHAIMAPPGVGKSLFLVRLAKSNVQLGKKVLLISCEMGEDDIALRFDAQFANHDIRKLVDDKATVLENIKKAGQGIDGMSLIIKRFPSGSADVNTIRTYLDKLAMLGFEPDLLIVDYVGEMKVNRAVKLYEAREAIISELRGLGIERDCCVVTAMQPNREAVEAMQEGVIDSSKLADAYGQLRPLDSFWTLNQSDAEKAQNLGRLWVDKNRSGAAKFTIYVQYDEATLAITEISADKYRTRKNDAMEIVPAGEEICNDFFETKAKARRKG